MSVYSGHTGASGMSSRHASHGDEMPWQRWQDWVNLILGTCLLLAPWFWRDSVPVATSMGAANSNAWIAGAIVVVVSLCALASPQAAWTEWINALTGIWLFVSPWLLGFTLMMRAMMSCNFVIGFLIAVLAIWAGSRTGISRSTASS